MPRELEKKRIIIYYIYKEVEYICLTILKEKKTLTKRLKIRIIKILIISKRKKAKSRFSKNN